MNAAHLHLMLNHVPVLGGLATVLLMVVAAFKENPAITKLTLQLMVLVGLVSFAVFFSGEPAEEIIEHLPGVSESLIERHEQLALYSLVTTEILAAIAVFGLFSMRKNPARIFKYWIWIGVIALVNSGLMFATANYGGEIRHTEIRTNSNAPVTPPPGSEERDDD